MTTISPREALATIRTFFQQLVPFLAGFDLVGRKPTTQEIFDEVRVISHIGPLQGLLITGMELNSSEFSFEG